MNKSNKHRVFYALMACILLMAMTSYLTPKVNAFILNGSQVCNDWTTDKQPIAANEFYNGQTVYLYYQGESEKPLSLGSFMGEDLDFILVNPNGVTVDNYRTRTWDNGQLTSINGPSGTTTEESGFLQVMNISSATEAGSWQISIYMDNSLLTTHSFVVNNLDSAVSVPPTVIPTVTVPPSAIPTNNQNTTTHTSGDNSLIIGIVASVAIIAAVAAAYLLVKKRNNQAAPSGTLPPPPPPPP